MRYRVGTLEFSGKHFLEVSAFIETGEKGFGKDVIFFAIHEEFDRSRSISMQLRVNDLFAMSEGVRELLLKGTTSFVKFTKSNDTGSKLLLEKIEEKYYLKMIRDHKMLSMGFDTYYFRAFHTRIVSLAKYVERDLYAIQKKRDSYV